MKDEIIFFEKADRYLDNELSKAERADFEKECAESALARKLFEDHRRLRQLMDQQKDRRVAREAIEGAYEEWEKEDLPSTKTSAAKKVLLWKVVAVAASLALLVSIGNLWYSLSHINQHKTNTYTILRREIDDIKRSQKDLISDLQTSENKDNPAQYGGTGFALSTNGYLATNSHVIKGADSIYVVTHDLKSYKVRLIYEDKKYDLAILKITDSAFNLPALPFGLASESAPLGEEIYTLGYPRNEVVYGKGYISAETGYQGDSASYQLTLPVNPGNSGGPLIDQDGKILGIISGKQSATDNVAFAVKSPYLLKMLDSLPDDFTKPVLKYNRSMLKNLDRIRQIKKLEKYVFLVKVFN